jgi:hypothetical protein
MDPKGKWRFIHANAAGVLLDSKIQGVSSTPANALGTSSGTSQTPPGTEASQPNSQSTSPFFGGPQPSSQSTSAFFGSGNEVVGAFIVGVAATSHRESIRVWNNRRHYDEWEFLGVDLNILGTPAGAAGQLGGPGPSQGTPGLGGRPSGPGWPTSPGSPPGPSISRP